MKNIKKIFTLLILSILFQTKNVKPFSKKSLEQVHFITSIMTILPSVMPDIKGGKKWQNLFNKHKKWENLSLKINKPNSWDVPEEYKTYIEDNISIQLYVPTLFNQVLAASLDKSLDVTAEVIENTKRILKFSKKIDNYYESKDKNYIIAEETAITTIEIITKVITRSIITDLLKNHRITKRISKIIALSSLDFISNAVRVKLEKTLKLNNPKKLLSTEVLSAIAKNIIVETLGENIQRLFIDNEKANKQKYLQEQINNLMNNNEAILRLKNNEIETKPIEIK